MGQQTDDGARALARQEADLDSAARVCAAHLHLPLSQADRAALVRGLHAMSDGLSRARTAAGRRQGDPDALAIAEARLRRLAQVMTGLHRIMAAGPQSLYPPDDRRDLRSEQAVASDRAYIALNRAVNPEGQQAAAESLGCWPDIPLAPSRFLHHAHAAYRVALAQRRAGPLRFLDVGCGGGIKVLLAAEFFPRADGLEVDAGYVAAARRVLTLAGRLPSRVIQGDALTFGGYGDYDVIYFYQPMKSAEGLQALERRIVAQARPGTVLMAPYGQFSDRAEALGCGRVDGAVYLSATPGAEADVLRQRAEHIGIDIPRPEDRTYPDGYLRTLIDACQAVGYQVV